MKRIVESRQPLVDWCFERHEASQGGAQKQQHIDTSEAEPPIRG
jgi:hypothetical protein